MKKGLWTLLLILPLISKAQISCPAFGRMQNYEQFEVLLTWNTVEPFHNVGGIDLDNDTYQLGDYTDQSIAPGITFNFYPDESTILRLKGIYTARNIHYTANVSDTFGNGVNIDTKLEQTLFKIAPGFGWIYFVSRFSFYGGFELPYTYHSDLTITEKEIDSVLGSTIESNSKTTVPGGFSIGLGCFAGSTFYFPSLLGVGFEVSSAYQYSKLGGDIVGNGTSNGVTFGSAYADQKTLWKFSPVMASLHLSIRF